MSRSTSHPQNTTATPRFAGLPVERFRCPDCTDNSLRFGTDEVTCEACGGVFPVVDSTPLLIPHDNHFFPILSRPSQSRVGRRRGWAGVVQRWVPAPGVNLARADALRTVFAEVAQRPDPAVLVLGAGNQADEMRQLVAAHPQVRVVYTDVDSGALIDLYTDAQCVPFTDSTFDAVVATGILSTMLHPQTAIDEMHRLLVDDGLVYSEMPFVQQIAFGPYDFHRWTLSGHRHAFRRFAEVDSGVVAGPATVLYWAIESLALCFVTSQRGRMAVKGVLRSVLSWIKHLDRLLRRRRAAVDGASNTYFLGRKVAGHVTSDDEIIARYHGAQ